MATKTVTKGSGRAAAAARNSKHAQRTPLPPKPGKIQAAKEAVVQTASLAKSQAKAAVFKAEAEASGWTVEMRSVEDTVELIATRGAEIMHQAWTAGVWDYVASAYSIADRTTKPRNASGARKYLQRSPEEADKETNRVINNKAFRKAPQEYKPARLPFDPDLATDEEIISALLGYAVTWHNRLSQSSETAIVGRDSHKVRITEYNGERIINICCPVTGYRSFRVKAITRIGRGRTLTKGQSDALGGVQRVEVE